MTVGRHVADPYTTAERTATTKARLTAGLTAAGLLTIALVIGLLALTAYLVVQNNQLVVAEERNVQEHRIANQADHDCLLQLALLLSDPKRDRTQIVVNPCPQPDLPRPQVPR